jgi:oxepin-CoA hydrolase/3-oxo-5,6-dehydrosuberyl-CoA semialdehyde dehydrogenase
MENSMPAAPTLQSFIAGRWIGQHGAQALRSALDGHVLAYSHEERPDFAEAVDFARRRASPDGHGLPATRPAPQSPGPVPGRTQEQLYALSHHSGATRADSWIDIEGGNATLFAYAGIGSRELPSGNLVHEGPAIPLGKQGHFAGSHILVPRRRGGAHQRLQLPDLGHAGEVRPDLPRRHAMHRQAGHLHQLPDRSRGAPDERIRPAAGGSLQLVIGSTGDLLDRLQGQDVVTFTGSADTAAKLRVTPNLMRNSVPFTAEADSLNCAILGPDVTPDSEEFELFIKEVARE